MKPRDYFSTEKLRGGFYTPQKIADFILRWATNGNEDYDILEPSCGDGSFLKQIRENNFKYKSIKAVEIIKSEAEKAVKLNLPRSTIMNRDFYEYCNSTEDRFDLVVGNPPYIRYQFFDKDQRGEAEKIFTKANMKYSKLTNAWVSFVVGSSLLLKEKGKIGFVLPAELLQVGFAKQLRQYLSNFYNKINIVSFRKLIFKGLQQEVILLLCEKNNGNAHLIEHLEVGDETELDALDVTKLKSPKKRIDFNSNKWTFYFLKQEEIDFIENILSKKEILPLRSYAEVEVGMTTGSNQFFTVSSEVVEEYNLWDYAFPLVGRSVQVPSVILTKEDWKRNISSGARAYFLKFPPLKELTKYDGVLRYLDYGKKNKVDKYYKTSIRDEWHIVPSAWVSDGLFLRRSNIYPKFVINEAKAYTTDTMHRISIKRDARLLDMKAVNINSLVASYYNSLSFASAEISGRSHGAGVLELMPNEVRNILVPYQEENSKMLRKIDNMMRNEDSIDDILQVTDEVILRDGYGFTEKEVNLANRIWKTLSHRRIERNKS